jgi:ABC-type Fe3+-hydroxamate transport system substrate-binding protein
MKKFLGILAIAGALVACNNSGESTTSTDSPATITDTTGASAIPPATVDTTTTVDTTKSAMDTTKK